MIPVKWYISIMLFAGAVTFVYGIANGDIKTILGSFLFTGIGGGAYLLYRKPRIGTISIPKASQQINEVLQSPPVILQREVETPVEPLVKPDPVSADSSFSKAGDCLPLPLKSENPPNKVDQRNWAWLISIGVVLSLCIVGTVIYAYSSNKASTLGQAGGNSAGISKALLDEAKAGDAAAQTSIGRAYWQGTGVPKDYVQAVYWLRKAAEQGNPGAQLGLGIIYDGELEEVKDVPQDQAQAALWLRKAAEQGNGIAEYLLGHLYASGRGVPQDYVQAVAWYLKAAEHGEMKSRAESELGRLYAHGLGVALDYSQAAIWYRKAAGQGDSDAELGLGTLYSRGSGVPKDNVIAASWFLKSADHGNADAQMLLGILYGSGTGVSKDYEKAAVWYHKAADQGNDLAQYNLATLYVSGQGVPQDYGQAAAWCRKAAEQGNTDAQTALGGFYEGGRGVEQSYVEAYYWFNIAVAGSKGEEREKLVSARDYAATKLTSTDLSQAQTRATDWFTAHPVQR